MDRDDVDVIAERNVAKAYLQYQLGLTPTLLAGADESSSSTSRYDTSSSSHDMDKYAMVVVETKHFYPMEKSKLGRNSDEGGIWALRDLSLALQYGECFGLLGTWCK